MKLILSRALWNPGSDNEGTLCQYLDLDEVENDGHVIDFYVSDVVMATGFVVLVSDLMSQSQLQLQQNLQQTNTGKN